MTHSEMNPSPYAIRKAIELLENSDNYLNNGFERAITTLIAAASRQPERVTVGYLAEKIGEETAALLMSAYPNGLIIVEDT